ncbi:MAG: tape measure protein, partial [Alphaproteobacteria bacterium]|nr:tape measure protein [Alphaproteobacteria bacterium]
MAQTIVGRLAATLDLDVRRFNQGLRSADVGIRVFERSVGASSAVIKDFATLAGGIGLTRIAGEAIMAGESMISLERRLNVMSNSMQKMGIEGSKPAELMTFLSTEADRMAFDFSELTKTFTQLVPAALATGLAFDEVKNVLTGTIGMANLMGASAQEMARAFVAIRQVIGKDRLQMEELRQQLGEAMPNSMVIVAEGLNQINKETGELGENLKITTASLNAMIQAGKIDGELFVRAWSIGTARAREFAEARSMMLSGQMTIARNIFERDVGDFMNKSGVNNFLAAIMMEFNKKFRAVMSNDATAASFGQWMQNSVKSM